MIQTLDDTFYIKPLPSYLIRMNEFNDGKHHVIYRQSIKGASPDCHFPGIKPLMFLAYNCFHRRCCSCKFLLVPILKSVQCNLQTVGKAFDRPMNDTLQ